MTGGLPVTRLPIQSHPDQRAYGEADYCADDESDETTNVRQCLGAYHSVSDSVVVQGRDQTFEQIDLVLDDHFPKLTRFHIPRTTESCPDISPSSRRG
jgi:hypothetical protein